jgi:nicotinamide mononucleotide (NMN) deamidase PncC
MDELARRVGARLKATKAILATAESCTGGWAAQAVTSVAGSSAWFDRGFITENPEAYCAWAADYQQAMDFYVNEHEAALEVLVEEGYDSAPTVEAASGRDMAIS